MINFFLLSFLLSVCLSLSSHFHQVVNGNQHFLLRLLIHSSNELPLQLRLRYGEAAVPIKENQPILVYLDSYPTFWEGSIEGPQGETTELRLNPRRNTATGLVVAFHIHLEITYNLECEPHFYGPYCTERCVEDDGGHFICSPSGEKRCREGWRGEDCSQEIPLCSYSPCKNNAKCLEKNNGLFECQCSDGFEGVICERQVKTVISTTSGPMMSTTIPTTTRTTPAPKGIKESKVFDNQIKPIHLVPVFVGLIFITLLVLCSFYYFCIFRKRHLTLHIPSPPKCDIPSISTESPPRYVPSPRRSASFSLAPDPPCSSVPVVYLSQSDLHV